MKSSATIQLSRREILSALDYLNYLDKRLELNEDAWWEVTRQVTRLQAWLERLSEQLEPTAKPKDGVVNVPQ